VSPLQSNYQEVLHAQAMLGTTGNRWPNGCTDSRLGVPSGFHIVEQTAAGLYYGALATTYGPFQSQDSITIGLGDESGTGLTSHTSAATPEVPFTLTSVDLNGDGNPDLVVLSADEDTGIAILSVFLGNGDGTYQPRTDYATRIVTTYVTVADVNNDNHPDLIVVGPPASGNSADPALQVFLNNGHGVFGSPINGPALPALRQFDVAVAAVVANFSGSNADIATSAGYVFLGDGTGNFTLKSGIQFSAADGLIAADFNHDDKIDIATVDGSKFTVSIYLGNGDGTFTAGPQYASIFLPPRDDLNSPDMYIPIMAFITYILLSTVLAGLKGSFHPELLGSIAVSAMFVVIFEIIVLKIAMYLLNITNESQLLDLIAYSGYKFVGVIVTLALSEVLSGGSGTGGWIGWTVFLYTFAANAFFLVSPPRN